MPAHPRVTATAARLASAFSAMQTPMDSCHLLQLTGAFGRRVDHLPDADPLDWSRNDGILSAPEKKGRSQKDREQVP